MSGLLLCVTDYKTISINFDMHDEGEVVKKDFKQ